MGHAYIMPCTMHTTPELLTVPVAPCTAVQLEFSPPRSLQSHPGPEGQEVEAPLLGGASFCVQSNRETRQDIYLYDNLG